MGVIAFNSKLGISTEGALCVRLTNRTGGNSVQGEAVIADAANDNSFAQAGIGAVNPLGAVYEAGIANGAECWVQVAGIVMGLVSTDGAAVRGNWVGMSTTQAGRFDMSQGSPPAAPTHFNECGHCLESKASGQLAKFVMHFN